MLILNQLRLSLFLLSLAFMLQYTPILGTETLGVAGAAPNLTPSSLPTGWEYRGCYSDSINSRSLRIASFTDVSNMTIESCVAFCSMPVRYNYAGVEFSRECYCDNVINAPALPQDPSFCGMACTGNSTEVCGGSDAINIFRATEDISSLPSAPVIVKSVGSFNYTGCFVDALNGSPRSLANRVISEGATAEICTSACKGAGFVFAGLEFGGECWCDNGIAHAVLAPDTDCNSVCDTNENELCGAANRLAVYEDNDTVVT